MRRLHLLRHAKSSWKDPSLRDRDRPLSGRGRRAAKAMAEHLRDGGVDPELVLTSPAVRALMTLEGIEPALGRRSLRVEPAVYGAAAGTLLGIVRAVPDRVRSVLVIGHNPGLEDLALELARDGPLVAELELKYPTGALATLAFEGPWMDLGPGGAELVAFTRPRDLE